MTVSEQGLDLLALARNEGDRHFNPATGLCLITRDTCWYAAALLFDPDESRRVLGNRILSSLVSEDGTHTPASMIALLKSVPDRIAGSTARSLREQVTGSLVRAAETEWRDGNVNHPIGAYCTLVCGGGMAGQTWAVELGRARLIRFRQRISNHRSGSLRQSEMSEYHSLTYTPLTLCFLALIAEYAADAVSRRIAAELEHGLWIDLAMHFHGPSNQFAGPCSRSYHEDSVGGFSALHGLWSTAGLGPVYLNPVLSRRFSHPSDLLQGALSAVVPFHIPERARTIAWEKPFPYVIKRTTYGESYHENSSQDAQSGFDAEVYPGGWSDLTTYLTSEFALGSAARPYVNAGHADAVMLRISRHQPVNGMTDFRSMFCRGVYNGALPGRPNHCHTTGGEIDASYLYEEGRTLTFQHEGKIIVCYTPKRAGHRGVRRFSVDLIFTEHAPFDDIVVDGAAANAVPFRAPGESRICLRDAQTYIGIIPLPLSPAAGPLPMEIRRSDEFLLISFVNWDGEPRNFTREEINGWRNGFIMDVRSAGECSGWKDFVDRIQKAGVRDQSAPRGIRSIAYEVDGHRMELTCDPIREEVLSRRWDATDESISRFEVSAAGETTGPFCPTTLFGSEGGM